VDVCIPAVDADASCLHYREAKMGIWVHTFGAGKYNMVWFVSQIMVGFSGNYDP
jgi:hypothetical protein